MVFRDRVEAGQLLAQALKGPEGGFPPLEECGELLVLAIPRGGVTVGAEVARELHAPLDVWLAHKIGAPMNPEFAIGSVSINGEVMLDRATIQAFGVGENYLEGEIARQQQALQRRMIAFRGHAEPVEVKGKTVVLVDDGVATGATAFSALASLKRAGAAERILAVPVAPLDVLPQLEAAAERVVVLEASADFAAVGQFYLSFGQVSDEEVVRLLKAAQHRQWHGEPRQP